MIDPYGKEKVYVFDLQFWDLTQDKSIMLVDWAFSM